MRAAARARLIDGNLMQLQCAHPRSRRVNASRLFVAPNGNRANRDRAAQATAAVERSSAERPNGRKPAAMPSVEHQTQRDEQRQGVECCGAAVSGLKLLDSNNK